LERLPHHLTHATGDLLAEDPAGLGLASRFLNREAQAVPEFSTAISGRVEPVFQKRGNDLLPHLLVLGNPLPKGVDRVGTNHQLTSRTRYRQASEQQSGKDDDET